MNNDTTLGLLNPCYRFAVARDRRSCSDVASPWERANRRRRTSRETPFAASFDGMSRDELVDAYWEAHDRDVEGHAFAAMDMLEIVRCLGFTPKR